MSPESRRLAGIPLVILPAVVVLVVGLLTLGVGLLRKGRGGVA